MNFDVQQGEMKKTSRSLGFSLEGIDFDLLPATNKAQLQQDSGGYLINFVGSIKKTCVLGSGSRNFGEGGGT